MPCPLHYSGATGIDISFYSVGWVKRYRNPTLNLILLWSNQSIIGCNPKKNQAFMAVLTSLCDNYLQFCQSSRNFKLH